MVSSTHNILYSKSKLTQGYTHIIFLVQKLQSRALGFGILNPRRVRKDPTGRSCSRAASQWNGLTRGIIQGCLKDIPFEGMSRLEMHWETMKVYFGGTVLYTVPQKKKELLMRGLMTPSLNQLSARPSRPVEAFSTCARVGEFYVQHQVGYEKELRLCRTLHKKLQLSSKLGRKVHTSWYTPSWSLWAMRVLGKMISDLNLKSSQKLYS